MGHVGGAAACEPDATMYLAVVGPSPLRYQPPRPSYLVPLPPLLMADPAPPPIVGTFISSNGPPVIRTAESPAPTFQQYTPFNFFMPFAWPWGNPFMALGGYNSILPTAVPQPRSAPAVDSRAKEAPPAAAPMTVTPEMLVDYFKPTRTATNSATSTGSGPGGFIAPKPTAPTTNATYRSP